MVMKFLVKHVYCEFEDLFFITKFLIARRLELLKTSRLSVVAFLNELPSTTHDLTTLTVDVNFLQVGIFIDAMDFMCWIDYYYY